MSSCQTFLLVTLCILSSTLSLLGMEREQKNTEELFLKHLPDGRVYAHFEFITSWDVHPLQFVQPSNVHHYGMFPKSLSEVVRHYQVQELHLSLTQGKWRTRMWGYPPDSAPPGAELWVWFLPHANADEEWPGLVNALSGLLGAHLNVIGPTSTYRPQYSFRPEGPVISNLSSTQLRYAAVPRETVCTENFTPWTKLLPCGTSAGLATLFSALQLYDSDFHSLTLHFSPTCKGEACSDVGVQLVQTLSVVFPPPLNNNHHLEWSLKSLFSKSLSSSCPLSSSSRVIVDTSSLTSGLSFTIEPEGVMSSSRVTYDLVNLTKSSSKFELKVKSTTKYIPFMPFAPLLHTQRLMRGSGHEWGGLVTEIHNNHPRRAVRVLYLDTIPWYFRVFLHTLHIENATLSYKYYVPAKDRVRPHLLELLLDIPPLTTASVSVQINRAFLKWTEHPPDAHHGFYVNSVVLTTVLEECANCTRLRNAEEKGPQVLRVHTEPLLITLATPDFSMPYNVICFVCTVIAIGFGSIFNLTTRKLVPDTGDKSSGLLARFLALFRRGTGNEMAASSGEVKGKGTDSESKTDT